MAVSDSKDLIAGGCDSINFWIGARRLSNCFCFLLFGVAVSVVAAGGGRFEVGFEADLAFRPRCDGVMVAGPSLSLGMVSWFGFRTINESKNADDSCPKSEFIKFTSKCFLTNHDFSLSLRQ
jgi:hypothetical protein